MKPPPAKRQRTSADEPSSVTSPTRQSSRSSTPAVSKTLARTISPPPRKDKLALTKTEGHAAAAQGAPPPQDPQHAVLGSPWQLTWIRDLPAELNKDAVTLKDLLGDPLITEVWVFNFLHDVDFIMEAFDRDTRGLIKIHLVHGFWKWEDMSRKMLEEQALAHKNIELHTAPMPEMFGTHHSKMMILFRLDDTAQVVIHTANMIAKDWTNMTNGVWQSPWLPKLGTAESLEPQSSVSVEDMATGGGARFKADLIEYLRAYNSRKPTTKPLVEQLCRYDFSSVRAALVASVPGRHNRSQAPWGWPALRRTLGMVPCADGESDVVVGVSSIATLGPRDGWLKDTFFGALSTKKGGAALARPRLKVVFPTPDEIRNSLDGYLSGGSIHTKIQSPQQAKQLEYLRPHFHHWANDSKHGKEIKGPIISAGRERAAAHIKTYIRYSKDGGHAIDWAMLTSANMSKQAWGEAATSPEVRIASWEIGVLVWPELLTGSPDAKMVGVFKTDMPDTTLAQAGPVVGLRVPYNVPLQGYGQDEVPWVASLHHKEPDRFGMAWTLAAE